MGAIVGSMYAAGMTIEEMEAFLGRYDHIFIPLEDYNGPLDQFRVYPDVDDVVGKMIETCLKKSGL